MKKKAEKIKLGWYVLRDCRDKFAQWCADKGVLCQEDCAGALIIWQYLPSEIREAAKAEAKGIPSVDKQFWADLRAGFEAYIAQQANNQSQKRKKK